MAFESILPMDWRSAEIVPLFKGKGLNETIIEALSCLAFLVKYMREY